MVAAYSPTGSLIIGTSERVLATANVLVNSFARDGDGALDFDHEGGSDVYWDTMETLTRRGKPLFVDENGDEWTSDQIVLEGEAFPALAFWTDDGPPEVPCAR